jgi:tetratricopeptide (TPR) repeat protein
MRAKEICESLPDSAHPQLAEVYAGIGALRIGQHRYDDAKPLLERAIGIWRQSQLSKSPQVAAALNNLAQAHKFTGNYRLADALYRDALAISGETLGEQHPSYGLFLGNFADLLRREGWLQSAATTYERAIAVLEARLSPDHPELAELRKQLSLTRSMPARGSAWTVDVRQLRRSPTP